MTRCLVGAAIAVALILTALPARAQVPAICAERQEIAENLERDYAETPVARGLAAGGLLIEVFAAPSGSFTVLATRPDGLACVLATGEGWEGAGAWPGRPA